MGASPPLPLVAPGGGLSRGPLRSRAAHRSRWSHPYHPVRISPAATATRAGQLPFRTAHPLRFPSHNPRKPPPATGRRAQKGTAPRYSGSRGGQLPEGQPTTPRYLPSAGGQKRPPATSPPVFRCCRVGDAGLPARKRPAPGIPWSLLLLTAVQTVRTPAAAATEAADRQAWKCGKAPQRLRRQQRQSGHSSGGTLPHSHTTPLPTLRGPAYACGSAPSAHRSYSISSNSPGNHLPPTSDKHLTPRLKSGYRGCGGTQSSKKHGPTSVCYAAEKLALYSAAARRLSCPGRKGQVI